LYCRMPNVIGIRFKSCGKIYDFEVNGLEITKGDRVIVESEFGLSIGQVITGPRSYEDPQKDLKKVLRIATEEDLRQKQDNENFQRDARSFCLERIMARGLPMKLVCSEVTLDRKRIVFYFTADGRIDFRELVKDLAAKFKTRIEMRQIGVRDKAKMVGGLGLCGKELCCKLFLTSFEPISIKMAKQQELVLNTGKLSGICGRLMCCLGYEYNEGGAENSVRTEQKAISPKEEAAAPDSASESWISPEVPCCPTEQPSGAAPSQPEKQDEKKKGEGFRKHKRRRRYRKKANKNE
jgi:cell fate regulator YaaT (PSP1 superfamily)